MNYNNYINNQTNSTPFWKMICSPIIDLVLLFITSVLIYMLWIIAGLPDISWVTIFVIISVILSAIIKRCCGTTLGNLILHIKPSDDQINKVTLYSYGIIIGIAIIAIVASNYLKTVISDKVIENDYYEIKLQNGWNAEQITESNSVLSCIAVGMNSEKSAWFFTVNYNTSGIPFDILADMVLGGINRGNAQDIEVIDTTYQDCNAIKFKCTLTGIPIESIVFLAPSGKLSYIMAQNMNEHEFENLISSVHLKNTHTSFADFDAVWKQFYGDNLECNIYQEIGEELTLEGWKYDKKNNEVLMNLIFNADSNDIKAYFNDTENKNYFINEMTKYQVMIPISNNYNKSVLITVKDIRGNTILSLPVNQKI